MGASASSKCGPAIEDATYDVGDENMQEGNEEENIWQVSIVAKTARKQTRVDDIVFRKFTRIVPENGMTIGMGGKADIHIDDTNLQAEHVKVHLTPDKRPALFPFARTYFLIGQAGCESYSHTLEREQIIKLGACSLLVTDMRLEKQNLAEDALLKGKSLPENPFCYICYEDTSTEEAPLLPSPCACNTPVHQSCLSQWIASKGCRTCSICKTRLPVDFTVEPPFLVLQVVRHMRGLHWTGEREYIISFGGRKNGTINIGSNSDCDLRLPDPSLNKLHCTLTHRDGKFLLKDSESHAGTYVRLPTSSHELSTDQDSTFKIGRTLLTVKAYKPKKWLSRFRKTKKSK